MSDTTTGLIAILIFTFLALSAAMVLFYVTDKMKLEALKMATDLAVKIEEHDQIKPNLALEDVQNLIDDLKAKNERLIAERNRFQELYDKAQDLIFGTYQPELEALKAEHQWIKGEKDELLQAMRWAAEIIRDSYGEDPDAMISSDCQAVNVLEQAIRDNRETSAKEVHNAD